MKGTPGLFALLLSATIVSAQRSSIDSLENLLTKSSGTTHVDQLNLYTHLLRSYDYPKAEAMARKSLQLSRDLKYKKGELSALLSYGIIESTSGNDSLAVAIFKEALALSQNVGDRIMKGRILARLAWVEQFRETDSAALHFEQSYQLLKDSAAPAHLSYLYLALSQFYQIKNDQVRQLSYLNRCWNIRKKIKDKFEMIWPGLEFASYYEKRSEFKKALDYLDSSQHFLGKDTVDNKEINSLRRVKGIIYINLGRHLDALHLFAQAKQFYDRNSSHWYLADLFLEVGYVHSNLANYEISLKYYFQALKITEQKKFVRLSTLIYFRIAWVYYQMNQYALAESYCHKTLAIANARYQEFEQGSALNLLGLLAMRSNQFQKAINFFDQALVIRKKNNNSVRVASTLVNLGMAQEKLKNYAQAEKYELQSLAIEQEVNHAYGISETYLSLGQLYIQMKEFNKAIAYIDKAELVAKKIGSRNILVDVYKTKREFWLLRSDYQQALTYSIKYESLRDSILDENMTNRILTLRHDFELDQKENEIKILNQESQIHRSTLALQQSEINRQRVILIVVIGFLAVTIIFAVVLFFYYKKVKQLNEEISERNEEINMQSEELRTANAELTKLNREVSEQKEEIQAQAEELIESNRAIGQINEVLEEKVKARTIELKDAYQELDTFFYRSSHDFRRPLTTFMGLAEVAKVMIKEQSALDLFEKVNITAHSLDKMLIKLQSVSLIGSSDLVYAEVFFENIFQAEINEVQADLISKKIEVVTKINLRDRFYSYPSLIKLMVQNLLENSIAFASTEKPKIFLSAEEKNHEIEITVTDNGQGIDPAFISRVFEMYFRANEKSTGNGLGLYIVKKAVDKLKGTISIKSQSDQGTQVKISIPK